MTEPGEQRPAGTQPPPAAPAQWAQPGRPAQTAADTRAAAAAHPSAWLRLSRWMVGTPWVVWTLVAVNLLSSVAGYIYWYGDSILAAPVYFWPFVPDSPLSATLWALALLAFHKGRQWDLIGLLAITGSIKYGLWTDWVWFTNALFSAGTYDMESIVLSANHFGMALEGLLLLPFVVVRLRSALIVTAYYLANDFIDYVLGYRPRVPNPESLDLIGAFAVVTTVILGTVWLYKALRAGEGGARPGT